MNLCMAYSDDRIIPALRRLAAAQQPITIEQIAAEAKVPYGTVQRRLIVLRDAGVISWEGSGRRWGHTYKVIPDEQTSS